MGIFIFAGLSIMVYMGFIAIYDWWVGRADLF